MTSPSKNNLKESGEKKKKEKNRTALGSENILIGELNLFEARRPKERTKIRVDKPSV